ncbi:metallophosphoesterase family protein [Vaginisenegalia massiliensis]|uniref:metallophosphoesterase family protein n=1 Tax=Vaginisenegalia massiliensis TaxID=2058294 RepID=UPI000F520A08|nr:metallophosphoesterase [Vaginisenegalia massiliensis]
MKFRMFGDLHYSENYLEVMDFDLKREAYFDHFMAQLFSRPADHYVSIGDLTNLGTMMEFMAIHRIIERHLGTASFFQVLGNHDLYTQTRLALQPQIKQDFYFSFVQDGVCVIGLDTNREKSLLDWSGYVDTDQLSWLSQQLTEHQDKVILIFAHHPLYDTTLYSTADKKAVVPECPLAEVLASHKGPGVYVCGHTHADSIVERDNWTYIQLADVMNQPCIRDLEIDSQGVRISGQMMDDFFRQQGLWLGSRMRHFAITDRGYQGEENRQYQRQFD